MDNGSKTEPKPEIPASLSTLILNLSMSALTVMGHEVVPGIPKQEVNLIAAKHTIDTLDMLKAKTEGNRSPEEDALLTDMLYQLKMAYVAAQKQTGSQPEKPGEKPAP